MFRYLMNLTSFEIRAILLYLAPWVIGLILFYILIRSIMRAGQHKKASNAEELQKWKELYDQGAITEQEYQKQRKKLLH